MIVKKPAIKSIQFLFHFLSKTTLRTWIILGVLFLSLGLFLEITEELHEAKVEGDVEITQFDHSIIEFLVPFREPALNGRLVDVTALGSGTVLTAIVVIFIVLMLISKERMAALYMLIASLGSAFLTSGLKDLFGRDRPMIAEKLVHVAGYSYPSGHSLSASAIYLSFALLACRYFTKWSDRAVIFLLAVTLITAIGFSRVYLGVHYPTDVAAGLSIGAAWAFLLGGISPWLEQRFENRSRKASVKAP